MFERYQADRSSSRSRLAVFVVVVSAVAHVITAAVLVISAWWSIDKLSFDERTQVGVASLGFTSAAPPKLASENRSFEKKELRRTDDLTQASENEKPAADSGSSGDPDGHQNGVDNGTGNDPNAKNPFAGGCGQVICADSLPPAPPVRNDPPRPPPVVPDAVLKAHLIRGNTQIQAPDDVRVKIARTASRRATGVIRLCISERGRVTSSKILKSTGHPRYDRKLVRGVKRWRYRPYQIGGKPAAVCTAVTFVYVLHD